MIGRIFACFVFFSVLAGLSTAAAAGPETTCPELAGLKQVASADFYKGGVEISSSKLETDEDLKGKPLIAVSNASTAEDGSWSHEHRFDRLSGELQVEFQHRCVLDEALAAQIGSEVGIGDHIIVYINEVGT